MRGVGGKGPAQREVCPLRALSAARRGCQAAGGPTQTAEPGRGASRGHGWPVVSTLPLNEVFKSSCCNSCKSAQKFAHTRSLCASLRFPQRKGGGCAASARRCVYATRALLAALCCTHSARAPHALRTAFRCVGHPAARAQPGSDIECPSPQPRHTDSTTSGSCTQIPGQRYTRKRHVVHAQRGGGGQWAAAAAARM